MSLLLTNIQPFMRQCIRHIPRRSSIHQMESSLKVEYCSSSWRTSSSLSLSSGARGIHTRERTVDYEPAPSTSGHHSMRRLWLISGILLGAYLIQDRKTLFPKVYAAGLEKVDSDTREQGKNYYSNPKFATREVMPVEQVEDQPNPILTRDDLKKLNLEEDKDLQKLRTDLQKLKSDLQKLTQDTNIQKWIRSIEEDLQVLEEDIKSGTIDPSKKFYTIKGSLCRFRAELTESGQLVWTSFTKVDDNDVRAIVEFYKQNKERGLGVSTGTHGSKNGKASTAGSGIYNPGRFTVHDLLAFNECSRVCVRIVERTVPPYTVDLLPRTDLINAWCYSNKTHDFTMGKRAELSENDYSDIENQSIKISEITNLFSMWYRPIDLSSDSKYIPLTGLEEEIYRCLNNGSLCYVRGIGGLGKSRLVFTIEERVNQLVKKPTESDSPDQKLANSCFETVFLSFKSQDSIDNFMTHAEKLIGKTKTINEAIERYFTIIGFSASQKGKQVLVVVDNIDSPQEAEYLSIIMEASSRWPLEGNVSPFKLLVTGRAEPNRIAGATAGNVINMQSYVDRNIWNIFSETVKEESKQEQSLSIIEKDRGRERFETLFKDFGNHAGFAIVVAKMIAMAIRSKDYEYTRNWIEDNFNVLIEDSAFLSKYGALDAILQVSLNRLDEDFKIHRISPSSICFLLALLPGGGNSSRFIHGFIKDHLRVGLNLYHRVFNRLIDYGLLESDSDKNRFAMPTFYHRLLRTHLEKRYESDPTTREQVDAIIQRILTMVSKDLDSEAPSLSNRENIACLIGLFNFAIGSEGFNAGVLGEKVSKELVRLVPSKLVSVTFEDLTSLWKLALCLISESPGYSLDPVLQKYLNNKSLMELKGELIQDAKDRLESNNHNSVRIKETSRSLNNLYVILVNSGNDEKSEKEVRSQLVALNASSRLDAESAKYINKNLSEPKKSLLYLFPEITFHPMPQKERDNVEKWKREKLDSVKTSGTANLSRTKEVTGGLRLLIEPLMKEKEIRELDLSQNEIGSESSRVDYRGLSDLLIYSDTLKKLDLSDNYLHRCEQGHFDLIIRGLKNNITLEELRLNNNSLWGTRITQLCEALKLHPMIKKIELHCNKFNDTQVEELAELMRQNETINEITIWDANWWNVHHRKGRSIRRVDGKVVFIK